MASPTTDKPSLSDKDNAADVNGHTPPVSDSAKNAQSEPDSEKENKTSSDKPDDALVNGKESLAAAEATPNGVAAVNGGHEKPEEKDAPRDATPAEAKTETAQDKPADSSKEDKENKEDKEDKEDKVEKKPSEEAVAQKETEAEPAAQEKSDVQMTDAANATDAEPAAAPAAAPAAPAKDSVPEESTEKKASDESKPSTANDVDADADADADAEADTVMTDDKPAVKAEEPAKPKAEEKSEAPPSSEVDLGSSSISQLAIESTSPADTSIEVSMTDAPATDAPAKNARERDEDMDEEPAAKRAKTEATEEDGAATATPSGENAGTPAPANDGGMSRLASISKWKDTTIHDKKISPFQRREIRKIIGRVKKTKHGGHFRDSVPKLWPALAESYLARIDKPMDLSEIDRGLRDPNTVYVTFGDMKNDLRLILENAHTFNGPQHEVTDAAFYAIRTVWQEAVTIPEDEPARPKSVAKPKPPREPRVLPGPDNAVRRQSSGPASSPPPPVPESKPKPQAAEPSVDRRGSTATDGDRPKRTKPMDLGKVSRMINAGDITNAKEFDKNVRLVFQNCYQFNGPPDQGNPVSMVAKQLEDLYLQQMKGKDAWLARYAKANAPAASASNASDDDDEDDSEEDEAAAPSVDNSKEIQELKAKLEEESSKLNRMFASGTPQALIDCQKVIVDTVQQALYKVAQSQNDVKTKHQDKSAKKASKPSKSKAAGSVPQRKSSTHAPPPKKSSSAKKPAPKKSLSAADKDQIASAINDLEYPHLDRAIDIIKRDTGQNENNEGELELDIDQLSNEALLKLWELCKKVLPGFGKDSTAAAKSPEVNRAVPAKQTPKSASKPKKNKPMSAQEQEARIAQLTAIQQLYKPGQEPADEALHAAAPNRHDESSDDSDSEEE
ncbi:sporulation transcription factor [Trichoderma sp. SZMC 28012]